MRAAGARIERAVFDQQQISRCKAADKEARRCVQNVRWFQFRPRLAVIRGDAFADAVGSAHEQPERAVLALDKHVLVELPHVLRHVAATAPRPRFACIGRDEELRTSVMLLPPGNRQHPFAGGKHQRLAHHHAITDAARLRPLRLRGIGLACFDAPNAQLGITPPLFHLRPKEEQPSIRRHPKFRIETANGTTRIGIDGEHFVPCLAIIAAGAEHDIVIQVLTRCDTRIPRGPESSSRRDCHARDAGEGTVRHRLIGTRWTEMKRSLQ